MRRLSGTITAVVAFAAICGLGLGCDTHEPYDAQLDVSIVIQPQGGLYVNTVTSTVAVEIISPNETGDSLDRPIELKWAWHSPSGTYNDSSKVYTTQGPVDQLTVSKSAPPGMYLDKKFWLTLTWTDVEGKHTGTSDTADCRVD